MDKLAYHYNKRKLPGPIPIVIIIHTIPRIVPIAI